MVKQITVEKLFLTRWIRLLGLFLSFCSALYVFAMAFQDFDNIPKFSFSGAAILTLIVGIAVGILNTLILAQSWRLIVNIKVPYIDIRQAFLVYSRAHTERFRIGKNYQFVGRLNMAQDLGMNPDFVLTTMSIEVIVLALAAGLAGLPGILIYSPRMFDFFSKHLGVWLLTLLLVSSVVAGSYFLRKRIYRFFKAIRPFLQPKPIIKSFALSFTFFILYAYIIDLMTEHLWLTSISINWSGFVPGIAIAWLVGFLVPGSPSGLGIREVVLMGIYAPEMGLGLAAITAIILRLLGFASEAFTLRISDELLGETIVR